LPLVDIEEDSRNDNMENIRNMANKTVISPTGINLEENYIQNSPDSDLMQNKKGNKIDIFGQKRTSVPVKGAH
jgi:3D (Asp-Asp-Asp) domain-containing protein